jgi:hypothetical protein
MPGLRAWHFSGSAGFVVGENGIVCTCCHVKTIRFCTASEEMLRLFNPALARESHGPVLRPAKSSKQKLGQLRN